MNYEFEKKEVVAKIKAEQEKKDLKKNMLIGISLMGVLLLFMFLLFAFRSLRINTKQVLLIVYNFLRKFVTRPNSKL
jgi:hypothetical protein